MLAPNCARRVQLPIERHPPNAANVSVWPSATAIPGGGEGIYLLFKYFSIGAILQWAPDACDEQWRPIMLRPDACGTLRSVEACGE